MNDYELFQIIQGSIGVVLTIIGGILLATSKAHLWERKPTRTVIVALVFSAVGLFVLVTSLPQYAIGYSVLATLALAIAAFWTIKQSAKDKEVEAEKNRRKELKNWIEEVLIVKAECSSLSGSPEEWRARIIKAKVLVAKEKHIIDLANRIDATPENKAELVGNISRLVDMLRKYEGESLSAPTYQEEIQERCIELLNIITK